jgi:pimeloyl-ACP methyl ester carboxylesterase
MRPTDLLLLPGLLCDAAAWAPAVAALERAAAGAPGGTGLRCRIVEFAAAPSLQEMAGEVLAQAPPAFALAGHSMGARVAMEVLQRAPGRVERLALLDTGYRALPAGRAGEAERARRYALLERARTLGMRAMGEEWARPMVHPSRLRDRALMDAILDMIARRTPEEFARQIEALLGRPDLEERLRSIGVPTLVACGRDDAWSPLAQHEEIAARLANARLVAFPDCGHMAPMERPAEVAVALAQWLGFSPAAGVRRPGRTPDRMSV